eukprot:gene24769-biopygen10219
MASDSKAGEMVSVWSVPRRLGHNFRHEEPDNDQIVNEDYQQKLDEEPNSEEYQIDFEERGGTQSSATPTKDHATGSVPCLALSTKVTTPATRYLDLVPYTHKGDLALGTARPGCILAELRNHPGGRAIP